MESPLYSFGGSVINGLFGIYRRSPFWLREIIARATTMLRLFLRPPDVLAMGTYRMAVDYADNASYKYLVDRDAYEREEVSLFLKIIGLNDVGLVVDVGANYGAYALAVAAALHRSPKRTKVLAIEPDARAHAALKRSIELNGFGDRIHLERCIAAETDGSVAFFENSRSSADNRSHSIETAAVRIRRTYELPARALDTLIENVVPEYRGNLAIVMDIQGNEPRALKGLRKSFANCSGFALFFEHSPELIRSAGLDHESSLAALHDLRADKYYEFRSGGLIEHPNMQSIQERARAIDREGDPTAQGASTDFLFLRGMNLPEDIAMNRP